MTDEQIAALNPKEALDAHFKDSGITRRWILLTSDENLDEFLLGLTNPQLRGWALEEKLHRLQKRQLTKLGQINDSLKPHWTLVPTFYIVIASLVVAAIGLLVALGAWFFPRSPTPVQSNEAPNPKPLSPRAQPSMTATSPAARVVRQP